MSFTFLRRLLRESRSVALACALVPAVPLADDPVATGRIEGTVRDINGATHRRRRHHHRRHPASVPPATASAATPSPRFPSGTVTLRATQPGWKPAVLTGIVVRAGQVDHGGRAPGACAAR